MIDKFDQLSEVETRQSDSPDSCHQDVHIVGA